MIQQRSMSVVSSETHETGILTPPRPGILRTREAIRRSRSHIHGRWGYLGIGSPFLPDRALLHYCQSGDRTPVRFSTCPCPLTISIVPTFVRATTLPL